MASSGDDTFEVLLRRIAETPRISAKRRPIRIGELLADRFKIERVLGTGGMGRVFAAWDVRENQRLAVKVLGSLDPQSLADLKREFRAASGLASPYLVALHELCVDAAEWFFTMDLVEGDSLSALLADDGRLRRDVHWLGRIFRELASALATLHQAGLIHRDLKPSNFLITASAPFVVLLDFGLARPLAETSLHRNEGTPHYMAPEQAQGRPLTEATDWWAFGVVLFEVLTGHLPPSGGVHRALLGDSPDTLADLCVMLLRSVPEDRPRAEEIFRLLGVSWPSLSPAPVHRGEVPPIFVGRDEEFARLLAAFDDVKAGRDSVVVVHGPSGIGKTTFAREASRRLQERGGFVLAGSCRERESVGYKAIDGIVDSIVEKLQTVTEGELANRLPDDIGALAVLFPALRALRGMAAVATATSLAGDPSLLRRRAIGALRQLLTNVAGQRTLVLFVDDLQWSDEESALLLAPLLSGETSLPVFFLATHRSGAGERVPLLEALQASLSGEMPVMVDLPLEPLPSDQARSLAQYLLRPAWQDDPELARRVAEDSGGHPLFIAELAFDAGVRGPKMSSLAALLLNRIDVLSTEARAVMELVAVAGVPVARSVIRAAKTCTDAELGKALDLLRSRHLIWSQGLFDVNVVDVQHDRVRDILLGELPADRRRRWHLVLADALQGSSAGRPEVLAGHFQAGGDSRTAGRYWLVAAHQAREALAFRSAADLYRRGLDLAELPSDEKKTAEVAMAETLAYAGQGAMSAETFLRASTLAPPAEQVEWQRRAAEQFLLSGHLDRGLKVIEDVLSAIGLRGIRGGPTALLSLAWGRLFLKIRGLRPANRSKEQLSHAERVRLDASWTIACSLGAVDFLRGAEFQTTHLRMALRAGDPQRLLRAFTLEAAFAAAPGPGAGRRSAAFLAIAEMLATSLANAESRSLQALIRGIVSYLQGSVQEALEHCDEAVELLAQRSIGAVWEMVTAHRFGIASLFFLGRMRRLAQTVPPLVVEAEANGNIYASLFFRAGYGSVAWLVTDLPMEARRHLREARAAWRGTGYQLSHFNLLLGDVFADLYEERFQDARNRLLEQWPLIRSAQLHRISVLRVQLWHLRAGSAIRLAIGQDISRQRLRLLREAKQLIGAMRRDPMPRSFAMADLVDAALSLGEDDQERAIVLLERAVASFEQLGMSLFAAAARVRLGVLEGGSVGQNLTMMAWTAFRQEGVVNPSHFLNVLSPGFSESITAEWSPRASPLPIRSSLSRRHDPSPRL